VCVCGGWGLKLKIITCSQEWGLWNLWKFNQVSSIIWSDWITIENCMTYMYNSEFSLWPVPKLRRARNSQPTWNGAYTGFTGMNWPFVVPFRLVLDFAYPFFSVFFIISVEVEVPVDWFAYSAHFLCVKARNNKTHTPWLKVLYNNHSICIWVCTHMTGIRRCGPNCSL
jgi:hypothetical protein